MHVSVCEYDMHMYMLHVYMYMCMMGTCMSMPVCTCPTGYEPSETVVILKGQRLDIWLFLLCM